MNGSQQVLIAYTKDYAQGLLSNAWHFDLRVVTCWFCNSCRS